MGKWQINNHKNGADIFEDGGTWKDIYVVALNLRADIARQIAREHNAHEELVALVNQLRKGIDFMKHDYDEFGAFPQENPWNELFDHIDAVLARAEG